MHFLQKYKIDSILLPGAAAAVVLLLWFILAGKPTSISSIDDFGDPVTTTTRAGISKDLPTPVETWTASKPYVAAPLAKRGEMDQGILLGLSKTFTKALDPLIQILRPVSPLAWFPLGLVLFSSLKLTDGGGKVFFGPSDAAALFTIAICSMWPTVVNTAVGVRKVPQDYLNVARVLKLSRMKTLTKVLIPSTMPYTFTGFRLSLGIAWLVIVAVEMLTGRPGVGGFIWQAYNGGSYAHIILCILTIGLVGYILDRTMSFAESKFRTA
jgi:nitrate/nitrite transport system permease protein